MASELSPSHTHTEYVYMSIGIITWELFLQITRHLLSIERKLDPERT